MIPKEKAKELFDKYCYAIKTEETDSGYFTNVIYAKQCALIAVDEIIKEKKECSIYECYGEDLNYWQKVKEKIKKL